MNFSIMQQNFTKILKNTKNEKKKDYFWNFMLTLSKFVKRDPSEHKVKDDADALIIESFFVNGSSKWQC